ncbi:MAG: hypothetical protein JNL95_04695 [Chitinophagales bacterium]|nr:hypothetical protein [Chitinophagales bacterium]
MNEIHRIYGEEIFFNFQEYNYSEIDQCSHLVKDLKAGNLDGFIMKNVFQPSEVEAVKSFLSTMHEDDLMPTPSGKIFPSPFAIITDTAERLDSYYSQLAKLDVCSQNYLPVATLLDRLARFFVEVGSDFKVSIPINKVKGKAVAPGTFRMFYPSMGGLHVHCGNLFQAQSMFFYSLIKNDIEMDGQLSYFVVLQQSESGGELTLYDMLWENVKRKESPENNEFVIDDAGNKIYVDALKSFAVKPQPGDILVFSGGPIWHRVENITGLSPRITFGGFLNFSKDGEELFYWS